MAGWSTVLEVAEAQTAPISMVGAAPEAIQEGKIFNAVGVPEEDGRNSCKHGSSHSQKSGSRSVETLTLGIC